MRLIAGYALRDLHFFHRELYRLFTEHTFDNL